MLHRHGPLVAGGPQILVKQAKLALQLLTNTQEPLLEVSSFNVKGSLEFDDKGE